MDVMKRLHPHLAAAFCSAAFLLCSPIQAADPKLSDFEIGTVQVGEDIDMKDLKGKVVVFEYWGTR